MRRRKIARNHSSRLIVRYTHVRRLSTTKNPIDFIINLFDEVQTVDLARPYVKVFYLGSVTQMELHGNITSYFLVKKKPDHNKPDYFEYIIKAVPISNVCQKYSLYCIVQ